MAPNYPPSEASVSDDLGEYDVISDAGLESSLTDLGFALPREIPPSSEAKKLFETSTLSTDDVQAYTQRLLRTKSGTGEGAGTVRRGISHDLSDRTVRVYVDGVFDNLNVGYVCHIMCRDIRYLTHHLELFTNFVKRNSPSLPSIF